jgi:hypothetical protein
VWKDDFLKYLAESKTERSYVEEALALKDLHLPTRLYKYRCDTDYPRDNLKDDTVWMASPESYNDPYDCALLLPSDVLLRLIEASLVDPFVKATKLEGIIPRAEIEKAKKSAQPLKSIAEHLGSDARDFWEGRADSYSSAAARHAQDTVSNIAALRKLAKVCSFSAANDSLLMWSHYANHHKGFCIEYDLEPLKPEHPFRHNLYPVVYSKHLYDLMPFAVGLTARDRQKFQVMLPLIGMLHKFEGWEYENEWRMIFEKQNLMDDYAQPAPTPTRIFLGSRLVASESRPLLSICEQKNIPIWRMRLSDTNFELTAEPFTG